MARTFRRALARMRGKWKSATPRRGRNGMTFTLGLHNASAATAATSGNYLNDNILLLGKGDMRPYLSSPPREHKVRILRFTLDVDFDLYGTTNPTTDCSVNHHAWLLHTCPDDAAYMNLNNVYPDGAGFYTDNNTSEVRILKTWNDRFEWPAGQHQPDAQQLARLRYKFNGPIRLPFKGADALYFCSRTQIVGTYTSAGTQITHSYFFNARVWNP